MVYETRGRPKKNADGKFTYQISGQLVTCLHRKGLEADKKGLFILATNDCSGQLSMQDMLANYVCVRRNTPTAQK